MRTFVLFALALTGTAVITDDASAFGRKNRRSSGCCGGGVAYSTPQSSCCGGGYGSYGASGYSGYGATYGAGYGVASTPCCGGSAVYSGGYYPSGMAGSGTTMSGQTVNGKQTVIQATDGQVYTLGSDGSYYPAGSGVSTLGGFTTQPYTGGYYGGYNSFYYPSRGIYQAGYPGTYGGYNGVYPAGGTTSPLTMPGINLPGGLRIVPSPMPNR